MNPPSPYRVFGTLPNRIEEINEELKRIWPANEKVRDLEEYKNLFDSMLDLRRQVHAEMIKEVDIMKYRLDHGYYKNNAEAYEKASDAFYKARENVDRFRGWDVNKDLDPMYRMFSSLNDEDAVYNKIMKNQREEDAFANSGKDSRSVIGRDKFFFKGEGGRRTRRYKKHSNKKRSGHKRLHKKRMSRRR